MDLLRQVLLRFDGSRLLEFHRRDPRLVDEQTLRNWIGKRIRLSDDLLEDYLGRFVNFTPVQRIFHLAVLSGDVIQDADIIGDIPHSAIMARLAFLNKADVYSQFEEGQHDLDLALMSGNPQIQLHAVSIADHKFSIPDPEIIPWTTKLIEYYDNLFEQLGSGAYTSAALKLAGYLHSGILSKLVYPHQRVTYLKGYCLSEMQFRPDRFTQVPEVDRLMNDLAEDERINIYFYSGYFPIPLGDLSDWALIFIWPDLARRLSVDFSALKDSRILSAQVITRSLVKRAREMLILLDEVYSEKCRYRSQLQALCGLPIDPEYLDDAIPIMTSVAHPQITLRILTEGTPYDHDSSVYYDLVNYFKISNFESDKLYFARNAMRKFSLLYANGKVLEACPPDRVLAMEHYLQ